MSTPAFAVMAAGIGSRYGGLKQIDEVGPNGESILDYSVYDAIRAGYGKVFFIISKGLEPALHEKTGKYAAKHVDVEYIYQRIDDLPSGISVPDGRVKPWGTGHAVMSCRGRIQSPFALINADDFYGYSSIKMLADHLIKCASEKNIYEYAMVAFDIMETLTASGSVSRGICTEDDSGYLSSITERTRIRRAGDKAEYEDGENWITLPSETFASMNLWGFTPSIFPELESRFESFQKNNIESILSIEYFLPEVVAQLIRERKARVKILKTKEKWYGITYKQDKFTVQKAIKDMVEKGVYPKNLWSKK